MEEEILNHSQTIMFHGTPCILRYNTVLSRKPVGQKSLRSVYFLCSRRKDDQRNFPILFSLRLTRGIHALIQHQQQKANFLLVIDSWVPMV